MALNDLILFITLKIDRQKTLIKGFSLASLGNSIIKRAGFFSPM
jgi:hypothetical protein